MNTGRRQPKELDRRTFLKLSGGALGALALSGLPASSASEPDWSAVGSEADFPMDRPIYLPDRLAFIIRRPDGVRGLSARCTHRSCIVSWSGTEFQCPCHQARFAIDGAVLAGPASEPLPAMPAKLEGGQVWLAQ